MKSWIATGCVLLSAVAMGDTAPAIGPIPIEQFTRHDDFGTLKISPDGQFIALTTGKFGREILAFIDLKDKKVSGGVRAPERFEIDDFYWVSPTRIIYMIAERQRGHVRPTPTGEIFGVDRDGKKNQLLYGYRAGDETSSGSISKRRDSYATAVVISTLKDDDSNILIAEYPWELRGNYWSFNPDAYPRITQLNVFNGRLKTLDRAPLRGASMLADRDDQVRFASGLNDAMRYAVSWKPEANAQWTAFELPGFREESLEPLRFSVDNSSVLFTAVSEGESLSALYRLDLKTHAVEKLYAFDGVDISDVVSDFANRDVVGVRALADLPRYHWITPEDPAARLHAALERAFKGQSVRVTSTSDDGRLAIVFVYSDTSPGDYYLFDTQTKKADFVRAARSWINPQQMRPMLPIEVTARDGLKLHGYLTQPAGEGPHPLIVLPHGGPHGVRDVWAFDWEVQLLASRGYAVLQVNFRGSEGYGMDFAVAGYGQWGASMQDDVTDATRWAIEQGIANADRICIYGASYGGYTALMGAAREPKLYRCAIGYVGVYDLELMFKSGDIPDSRSGLAYLRKVLGEDSADLRARSPVNLADRIEVPVLLIHGKEDWRADYKQAKRMRSALESKTKPFEWMALSREGHGVYDEETRREVYERILAFLDKHLSNAALNARSATHPQE
jgi:dipeptidyl aminopeptidase/acylaminoacyl peptidase